MYGKGWIKMGAGASFFFKNAGPVFKWFILLISISLNMFIEYSVMITRLHKLIIVTDVNFFLLQPGLLHAQQGGRGDGVGRCAVVEGHRSLQLHILDRGAPKLTCW